MSSVNYKHQLYDQLAAIGKAISHGRRLEILEYLAQGERTVESVAKLAGLTVANTSRHLQLLRQAGLVTARKEGLHVFYRAADDGVVMLAAALRGVAEAHRAELTRLLHRYFGNRDGLEPIPRPELLARAREGLVTVVDVRPPEEYAAGHVPGAVNIPLKELEQRLQELPRGQEVVAYCRGPYCVLAYEAVARLREHGYAARRMEDGFPEWRAAGLPVESEPARATRK
jgi:rhodanese-related sulfurtransferase/DNA-binding MarR family transcriptional regulator